MINKVIIFSVNFLSIGSFFKSVWDFIENLLIFAIVLGVIVGIHELGHFIFARRANVLCREYAIGMGPTLLKKRIGETVYSLRALPLGGFCAIAGEEVEEDPFKNCSKLKLQIVDGVIKAFYPDIDNEKICYPIYDVISYDIYDENDTGNLFMEVSKDGEVTRYAVDPKAIIYSKKEEMQIAPHNRTLVSKSKSARALVMFGGPLMNFLLAIIVYFIAGLCTGFVDTSSNVLGSVSDGSSISEYYYVGYSLDTIENREEEGFAGIYCSSISLDKYGKDVKGFLEEYKEKKLSEQIIVVYQRENFLTKDDRLIAVETKTLGKQNISSWDDLSVYLDKYDQKSLVETIKLYYTRGESSNEYIVDSTPFLSFNTIGFGSGWVYDPNEIPTIRVIDDTLEKSSRGLASNTGLKVGDKILKIENIENPTWADVRKVFDEYKGDSKSDKENRITMKVLHADGKTEEVNVKPYSRELIDNQTTINGEKINTTDAVIGLGANVKFSLGKSIGYAFTQTGTSFLAVFRTFKLLFNSTVSIKNLSGPIGIFSITSEVKELGFTYLLSLIGLLSVNIGLMNLLPIPALDGGRLVFLAYEAVTKKKPSQKVETILITATFILLLALMVFVAIQDIISFI